MITRSKARKTQRTIDTMSSNGEIAQQIREGEDSNESEEINNQLGIPGIYDEMTPTDIDEERQKERPDVEVRGEVQQRNPEVSEIGAGGQVQGTQEGGLERIFLMLQHMQQNTETMKEELKAQRDDTKALREELREFREENLRMHQETRGELRKTEKELRAEMQQMREELKAETKIVKEDGEKTRLEMEENKGVIKSLKSEINKNRQQITTNTNNLSDNLNRINSEIRGEVKLNKEETTKVRKNQEEIEEQVKKLEEKEKRRIDEIKEGQDQLTRRINEVEGRPINRAVATDSYKDVTFNGTDCYPMEFLKELKEIRQLYYSNDDIKWIGRHLTDEAMIWWRIIKYGIHSFDDFENQFINKYWGSQVQENVRDRLEYGRYRPNGSMSAVQYVQKHILQCRQLVPPIMDQHLITKLSRHFCKEIQVAVLVRSIKDIAQFEILLQDYERINSNGLERQRYVQPVLKREHVVDAEPTQYKHKENFQKGKFQNRELRNKAQHSVDVINAEPGTSSSVPKNGVFMTLTQ